ncbi:MAG: DUF4919 domain-containing protein [Bacteroidales bacterium]|nr:DUF4919 domain-containing protein [Bacteroidales bacterium]
MKKIFAIILVAIGFFVVAAAPKREIKVERPDMNQIRNEVTDPASKYYYPKLMDRYLANETVMQLPEYRRLYLGYVFQEDYNPYRHSEFYKRIEPLYYKDQHTRAELDTIIKYAELSLDDNPFDLRQLNFLIYALRKRGKVNRAAIWQYRMNHLLEAILSTGTGLDPENAWVVINPEHEYNIINFMGEKADAQQFVQPHYDYVRLKPGDPKSPAGYYFNIRNLLEEYYRKFPEE